MGAEKMTLSSTFAKSLFARIADAYAVSGNQLGWRLLYSPAEVLDGAKVALIGLNPGGRAEERNHAVFSMGVGSAYELESWRCFPPGKAPLQQQILELFKRLGVRPECVLAGNLVPFRSPDWKSLHNPEQSVAFGTQIWTDILERAKPDLIVSMGKTANHQVRKLVGVTQISQRPAEWGAQTVDVGIWEGGHWLGLPHLSQFKIMKRAPSRPALQWAFEAIASSGTSGRPA